MTALALACLTFFGLHMFVAGTPVRGALTGLVGERAYLGLFSLASLAALAWIGAAYTRAPVVELWAAPPAAVWLTPVLVFLGMSMAVFGVTTPNPTSTGAAGLLRRDNAVHGILAVTRHPLLWGVALWAAAHLLANGDLASIWMFGCFLALALVGSRRIDAKRARRDRENWARFAAATSWFPFLAIAQGRAQLRPRDIGWRRAAAAVAIYVLFAVFLHRWLFGVAAHPGL